MAFPLSGTPYPTGSAQPSPAYSGVFIPTIWSGKLVTKFYDSTVLAAISNTDYENEIRNMGDTVKIRTKPTVTIRTYQSGQSLTVERPSAPTVDLQINKGQYWNVILDDVMQVQSDLNLLNMWAADASEGMKITVDTDVLAGLAADISPLNLGATAGRKSGNINLGTVAAPLTIKNNGAATDTNPLDLLVDLGTVLDEQNIPENNRWVVIPAWLSGLIKKSDLKDAALAGDATSILRNGRLGMIDRFTLYLSNLLPQTTGKYNIYAGTSEGLTFAAQLTNVETLRAESAFGTLMRGLLVYGYKVVNPVCLAMAVASKAP